MTDEPEATPEELAKALVFSWGHGVGTKCDTMEAHIAQTLRAYGDRRWAEGRDAAAKVADASITMTVKGMDSFTVLANVYELCRTDRSEQIAAAIRKLEPSLSSPLTAAQARISSLEAYQAVLIARVRELLENGCPGTMADLRHGHPGTDNKPTPKIVPK